MKAPPVQIAAAAALLLSTRGARALEFLEARATLSLGAMQYVGCYASSAGLKFNNTWTFQTQGYCQPFCVGDNQQYVLGLTGGDECWCGKELPPANTLVANSSCLQGCNGYGADPCGSKDGKYFTVWTSGVVNLAQIANASDANSTSSTSSASNPSTPTASPYVTTVGTTVITVTASPQGPGGADDPAAAQKHAKANTAGIIAGVVVGIVLVGAAAGGGFLFLRHRRRKEIEDEYQRNANINQFVGTGKPPGSSAGFSNVTDTRLDHSALQRRMSDGSIADNEDYSRKILRVTNA